MNDKMNVLVSAYACGPNWGSEIGMGWNWVINLSNYCQLTVITEKGFENDIKEALPKIELRFVPKFIFIDIGEKGRKLFWKQGSFSFYRYYKKWQKEAYQTAQVLISKNKFDIIHQLNMIGFREPGFLWKIKNIPFIWGPVGGVDLFPVKYLKHEPWKSRLFLLGKNMYSQFQFKFSCRVKKAARRADIIFTATAYAENRIKKKESKDVVLLNETGCRSTSALRHNQTPADKFTMLWVGRMEGRKALPIALNALREIKDEINVQLIIAGDGPLEEYYKGLIKEYNLENVVVWKGRIDNAEVNKLMRESSVLLFTSLREGTPHVVTEAIQNGLPVVCHDSCGHGAVVTSGCGIKIPMVDFKTSVKSFSSALIQLAKNNDLLQALSKGAVARAAELSWDSKAKLMYDKYLEIIESHD